MPLPREPGLGEGELAPEVDVPGPSEACPPGDDVMDMDDVFDIIVDDLSGEDIDDQVNYRYLSLANRRNAGLCEPDLDVERQALVKAVNSLSLEPSPEVPLQVDDGGVIYRVDLRDYGWNRAVTIAGQQYSDVWEAVVQRDVFSVQWRGDAADDVSLDTGSPRPVVFASSFIATATDASTYYALLGIPENVDDFILGDLGIDVETNFADQEVIRAGFSGVRRGFVDAAFLAERHDIEVRSGYLWQISEFGAAPGDLLANPLGDPTGERELVFTLPNGFLGFAFADAAGDRLDESSAFSASPGLTLRASFGRYARGVDVVDEVHQAAENGDLAGHVNVDDMPKILEIYPSADALTGILEEDRDAFGTAVQQADLPFDAADPMTRAYSAFASDVGVNVAAGDLMMTPDALLRDLRQLPESMQVLDGGRVRREDFARQYMLSLCTLSVALENFPDAALCDEAQPMGP